MENSLCLLPGSNGSTAVKTARNNFELEFLGEADFGSVVAVNGHVLEGAEKFTFELNEGIFFGVGGFLHNRAVAPIHGVVQRLKQRGLLRGRGADEILSVKHLALRIEIIQAVQEA